MVAKQFPLYEVDARWLGYLALSLLFNVLLIYNIKMGLPDDVPAEAARIRVALKSMVLPKPQPVSAKKEIQQLEVEPKQIVKSQPIPQPVAVAQTADEKIVINKAESDIQIETEAVQEAPVIDQPVLETGPSATSMVDTTELPEIHQAANIQQPTYETAVMPAQPVASNEIVEQINVVYEAKYRKKTPPEYPQRALELGQQGVVTLHAKVMPSGQPDEIKVVDSSGFRLLDKAALAAVKHWEFVPTNVNGQAIVSWVSVPVNFVIQ